MSGPSVAVLIASHIRYDGQIGYLIECIGRLLEQTYPVDVYISISSEKKYDKYVDKYIKYIKECCPESGNITFNVSETPKYQMEHFKELLKYIDKYNLVMFSDDDDTYHPYRVEAFVDCYNSSPSTLCFREVIDDGKDYNPEYWSYALHPSILHEFYKRIGDDTFMLQHVYADMFFRGYLRRMKDIPIANIIPQGLTSFYNYNIENPDSICEVSTNPSKITLKENELNNMILYLSYGRKMYIKAIKQKQPNIKVSEFCKRACPDFEKYLKVCDRLYDIQEWKR